MRFQHGREAGEARLIEQARALIPCGASGRSTLERSPSFIKMPAPVRLPTTRCWCGCGSIVSPARRLNLSPPRTLCYGVGPHDPCAWSSRRSPLRERSGHPNNLNHAGSPSRSFPVRRGRAVRHAAIGGTCLAHNSAPRKSSPSTLRRSTSAPFAVNMAGIGSPCGQANPPSVVRQGSIEVPTPTAHAFVSFVLRLNNRIEVTGVQEARAPAPHAGVRAHPGVAELLPTMLYKRTSGARTSPFGRERRENQNGCPANPEHACAHLRATSALVVCQPDCNVSCHRYR